MTRLLTGNMELCAGLKRWFDRALAVVFHRAMPALVITAVFFWIGASIGWPWLALILPAALRRSLLGFAIAALGFGAFWRHLREPTDVVTTSEDVDSVLQVMTAPEPAWPELPGTPTRERFMASLGGRRVQVSAPLRWEARPGECAEVLGTLTPWPEQDFAQGLDVRALKRRRGIVGLLTVKHWEWRECAIPWLAHVRRLQRQLADALLRQGGGTTAAAVLLGDRRGLDTERLDAYARSGITHVLSVSGLHVSACALVVFGVWRVFFGLLRFIIRLPAHRCAAAATVPVVVFYVLLTGAEVPAMRSASMAAVVLFARVTGRQRGAWWAFGASAWLILLWAPESAVEPTFLFSFISVAGLITAPKWVGVATWPISIAFFQQLSWIGVLTNIVAIPLSSFGLVLPGLAWLVVPHPFLARVVGLSGSALDVIAEHTAFGAIDIHVPYVGLVYLAWALKRWRWVLFIVPWAVPHYTTELHMLPVGQGDGMVYFDHGKTIVIDTGGDPQGRTDPGARVLRPFLLAHGVSRIDCLIVTHQHPDHSGGAVTLQRLFDVRRTLTNRDDFDCPPFTSLNPYREEFHENDNSLVLHADRLLLTGDMEALAEGELTAPRVEVLKVGHHGSRTSTTARFLEQTQPRVALISVGRDNHFGHPHPEVLERLHAAGVVVYRTDLHGHIAVLFGTDVRVRPFRL